MITCSNCGAGIPDDVEFCQQCGAPRPESEDISSTEIVIDPPLEEVPTELDAQEWVPEERKSNTCLWVVFSCLVLFLVCACVMLVVVGLSLSFVQGIFDGIIAFNFLALYV